MFSYGRRDSSFEFYYNITIWRFIFQRELLHYFFVSYTWYLMSWLREFLHTKFTNVQVDQNFEINFAVDNLDWLIKEVQGFRAILCFGQELKEYEQINLPVHDFPRQSCSETLRFLIPPSTI